MRATAVKRDGSNQTNIGTIQEKCESLQHFNSSQKIGETEKNERKWSVNSLDEFKGQKILYTTHVNTQITHSMLHSIINKRGLHSH